MRDRIRRSPPHRWRVLIIAALLLGAYAAGSAGVDRLVAETQAKNEAHSRQIADAAVEAIRQRIEGALEAALTLQVIARHAYLHEQATGLTRPRLLERHLQEVAEARRLDVRQVGIIDASGRIAWSTSPRFIGVDLSERDYFQLHRDGRMEPSISAPVRGVVSGELGVQVTQPFFDRGGAFAGIGMVSLDPLAISAGLDAIDFGAGAVAVVIRQDGTILARSEDPLNSIGRRISQRQLSFIDSVPQGGALIRSEIDGRRLLCAWQTLPKWGVTVAFGLDYGPIEQAAARQRQTLTFALFSLLAGATGGLLLIFAGLDGSRARFEAAADMAAAKEASALLAAMPGRAYRGTIDSDGNFSSLLTHTQVGEKAFWPEEALPEQQGRRLLARPAAASPADARAAFFRDVHAASEAIREFQTLSDGGGRAWVREHCRVVNTASAPGSLEVVGLIIDITEERTIKAQAIAAAKLATLGEMATGVAHELNQPCATITLAADVASFELARGTPADLASARQRLDDIAVQTARLREVIDHFQIFSRMPDGQVGAVSLPDVVSGALKISNGMLNASGISVAVDLPATLPMVHAEVVPLEQVLVNLFVNARDAMRCVTGRHKQIDIAARHDAAAGRVILTVRDHGEGLPPGSADRLFEPFFTTKPAGQGTGLGLSIAYGAIRGFGGTIDIANHADGGAVVTLCLAVQEGRAAGDVMVPAQATAVLP
jgi:C4-dicarboxylate-specific signal transduction histidine kinase